MIYLPPYAFHDVLTQCGPEEYCVYTNMWWKQRCGAYPHSYTEGAKCWLHEDKINEAQDRRNKLQKKWFNTLSAKLKAQTERKMKKRARKAAKREL